MNILLVSPKYPETFWSFKHALKFTPSKRTTHPPLGLLTVAAMLPEEWEKKLADLNVNDLTDADIEWADYVFMSATSIQKKSVDEIIKRCNRLDAKIVAGGPYYTSLFNNHGLGCKEYEGIDHLVFGEAEITLQPFLDDLANGQPKPTYATTEYCDITTTPVPAWELVDMKPYISMSLQYSRGCPFDCDFCDITRLCGRTPRTKTVEQVIAELEALYQNGWRASVFFVDDNFISNKKKLKNELLPEVKKWMNEKRRSFSFLTQASINLADDEDLMRAMTGAGFEMVFVGIETPDEAGLESCSKSQNRGRDLIANVKKMQHFGLQVQGGFIVGFDSDTSSIFKSQIEFIQKSGIVTAMVGLLNALQGTRLYDQLLKEDRMLDVCGGDNTNFSINFKPKMDYDKLIAGYKEIVSTIYSPEFFYKRINNFLDEYVRVHSVTRFSWDHAAAFFISIWKLGIVEAERLHYWRLFFRTLFTRPRYTPLAVTLAIYGYHFRKVFEGV